MFGHLECLQFNVFTVYCSPSYLSYRECNEDQQHHGGQDRRTDGKHSQICSRQGGGRRPEQRIEAFTEERPGFGLLRCPTVHLSAHHLGIVEVPLVVTHGSPLPVMVDLHSARAPVGAVHKLYLRMA